MLEVAILQVAYALMRDVIEPAAPNFQEIYIEELLEDSVKHLCLRIIGLLFRKEFIKDPHASVDNFLEEMQFPISLSVYSVEDTFASLCWAFLTARISSLQKKKRMLKG
jgi:hypothetical protein